jgi:integrase
MVHPNGVHREFVKDIRQAQVPVIRPHDLRHTFVTLALQAGQDVKVVSEIVGHSDPGITMRIYQHITKKQHRDTVQVVAKMLL